MAYFFNTFEPDSLWSWIASYSIAISIDVAIYLLSWTAFLRYLRYRSWRAVWQHWLLILLCILFSLVVNWAYSKQFHSATALSIAEQYAPWLSNIFPFLASCFPLLGIVYSMMAVPFHPARPPSGGE